MWIGLFLLIAAVSFFLALRSMRDFEQFSSQPNLALFLIRGASFLDTILLNSLYQEMKKNDQIFSLERLFKGTESALIIFGPKQILQKFTSLNLLELEDYQLPEGAKFFAWEVAKKQAEQEIGGQPFSDLPALLPQEQFWWQVTLKAASVNHWQAEIKAVLVFFEQQRGSELLQSLHRLGQGTLTKIPRPQSNNQILQSYLKRSQTPLSPHQTILTSREALQLLGSS